MSEGDFLKLPGRMLRSAGQRVNVIWEVVTPFEGVAAFVADSASVDWRGNLVLTRSGQVVGRFKQKQWGAFWDRDARLIPPPDKEVGSPPTSPDENQPERREPYKGPLTPREPPRIP